MQFHTAESFAASTASHDIYDQLRTPDLPADEVARLTEQTKEIFADLEVPPGAADLGDLFRVDAPDGVPHSDVADGAGPGGVDGHGDSTSPPAYDVTHPQEVYDHSVHNAASHDVMLGKWVEGDPAASYTGRAEAEGYTYFSSAEWKAVKEAQGLDDQVMFDLYNTWFLDQQIYAGKTFHFSHPPQMDGSFLGQELAWLEYRGYRYDPETMTAVPGAGW